MLNDVITTFSQSTKGFKQTLQSLNVSYIHSAFVTALKLAETKKLKIIGVVFVKTLNSLLHQERCDIKLRKFITVVSQLIAELIEVLNQLGIENEIVAVSLDRTVILPTV
jgi:hypothetical protein